MKIANSEVKGITCDSKAVKKNFVFVAIKGTRQDGRRFIKDTIANGASVVVIQGAKRRIRIPEKVKLLKVNDCRKFLSEACAEFYGHPSRKIKVVGITGTNGKTTVSYLIEAIAKKAGHACGVIGTISHRFRDKQVVAKNTTPGPGQLQELLSKMLKRRIEYCAMEVSSHALHQKRVAGVNFACAIFTNLTHDHLDYHKNLESYFQAKADLFRALADTSVAIINNDDKYSRRLNRLTRAKVITYGIKNRSDLSARDIKFSITGSRFTLSSPKIKAKIKTHLVGEHNIYNILAAISWGISENLDFADIKSAIENFKSVPGRLEKVGCRRGYNVFVDYAHTPDALLNVITALRPLVSKRIILIFGCGGERDKLKRPKMGRIVTQLADYAIITSDNPRSEDPLRIIRDICAGVCKDNFRVIPDRFLAIQAGLRLAEKDDCLIIAGKGHEDYQVLKNKVLFFSDRKAVEKCLRLMK